MTEDDEKERARYLEDWIKSHLVAGMNVELAEGKEYETLASTAEDNKISFKAVEGANEEAADWEKVTVQPGDARILAKKEVSLDAQDGTEGDAKVGLSSKRARTASSMFWTRFSGSDCAFMLCSKSGLCIFFMYLSCPLRPYQRNVSIFFGRP